MKSLSYLFTISLLLGASPLMAMDPSDTPDYSRSTFPSAYGITPEDIEQTRDFLNWETFLALINTKNALPKDTTIEEKNNIRREIDTELTNHANNIKHYIGFKNTHTTRKTVAQELPLWRNMQRGEVNLWLLANKVAPTVLYPENKGEWMKNKVVDAKQRIEYFSPTLKKLREFKGDKESDDLRERIATCMVGQINALQISCNIEYIPNLDLEQKNLLKVVLSAQIEKEKIQGESLTKDANALIQQMNSRLTQARTPAQIPPVTMRPSTPLNRGGKLPVDTCRFPNPPTQANPALLPAPKVQANVAGVQPVKTTPARKWPPVQPVKTTPARKWEPVQPVKTTPARKWPPVQPVKTVTKWPPVQPAQLKK